MKKKGLYPIAAIPELSNIKNHDTVKLAWPTLETIRALQIKGSPPVFHMVMDEGLRG